jgi:mRNA-degrading endonuclease toxin of MazEF toxin-antitoxin module
MTERGDVLQFRARVGFGATSAAEHAVVVQASELCAALPTMLVVPLDLVSDPYVDRDLLVAVPADEAGTKKDCVAIPTHLRFVRGDRFEPGRVSRLRTRTLTELDEKLRLALDL